MTTTKVSKIYKQHYDNYYNKGCDSEWRWLGAIKKAENIIAICQPYPHCNILEIGAGEGSILKRLSELSFGNSYSALEISSSGIQAISSRGIEGLREALLFNGYTSPYQVDQFDLVILSHVIEHVEYPRKLLYEAARVAEYFFVEVPLENNIRLKQNFVLDEVGHINFYTAKTIRRLLQSCGLKVLQQTVTNSSKASHIYFSPKKGQLKILIRETLIRFFPFMAPLVFTYHSSLICTKDEIVF